MHFLSRWTINDSRNLSFDFVAIIPIWRSRLSRLGFAYAFILGLDRKITSLLKLFSESGHLFFKFIIERE